MIIEDSFLTPEERISFALRSLFEHSGYQRFTMSRFEEYDLYMQCRDFLAGDHIITFTDLDGRLMALKPDVTMSIVRRVSSGDNAVHKIYYNENIYRASNGDTSFREIMQTGVECIGALSFSDISDMVCLAARALETIRADYRLAVSHPGFITGLLDAAGIRQEFRPQLYRHLRARSISGLDAASGLQRIPDRARRLLQELIRIHGDLETALPQLRALCINEAMETAVSELALVQEALQREALAEKVQLDFSIANNMDYYDGIMFQGFLPDVPTGILSGGQYGGLLQKMGKDGKAIGFAVYTDELRFTDHA